MVLKLPADIADRCRDFGHRLAAHYAAGGSPRSRAVSYRGVEANPRLLARGKMGECIFCCELGFDPLRHLDWSADRADRGWDFGEDLHVDVKATHMGGRRLIWPKGKNDIFTATRQDVLILVKVDDDGAGFTVGFVLKEDFAREKRIADRGGPLDPGTWYMDMADIPPIESFLVAWGRRERAA